MSYKKIERDGYTIVIEKPEIYVDNESMGRSEPKSVEVVLRVNYGRRLFPTC